MAIAAVVDESRLERRFDPGDLGEVDVSPQRPLARLNSKSNSSTRLPRRTTTRVSSGWEASMIILLAMANSLAARQNSPRGPNGPPVCAARGVYVGDWEIWRLGNQRPCFSGLTTRDRGPKNPPRRRDCGGKVLFWPSEHRHPEHKAWHGSSPFKWRRMAPMSRSRTRRRLLPDRSICFPLVVVPPERSPAEHSDESSTGRQPAPTLSAQAAGRHMTVPADASLNR